MDQSSNTNTVRGLLNRGNTCFLNGTLQALAAAEPVQSFIQTVIATTLLSRESAAEHAREAARRNDDACNAVRRIFGREIEVPLLNAIEDYGDGACAMAVGTLSTLRALSWLFEDNAPTLVPHVSLEFISGSIFCDGAQHDAHELLTHMLQTLDEELVQRAAAVAAQDVRGAARLNSLHSATHRNAIHGAAACTFALRAAARRWRRARDDATAPRLDDAMPHDSETRACNDQRVLHKDRLANRGPRVLRSRLERLVASSMLRDPFVGCVAERIVCSACAEASRVPVSESRTVRGGRGPPRRGNGQGRDAHDDSSSDALVGAAFTSPPPSRPWQSVPFTMISVQPAGLQSRQTNVPAYGVETLTIEACLAREFADEALPGDYRCDGEAARPDLLHRCVKRRALVALPPALCIHVNRLLGEGAKVRRRVRFDLSLDVAPFMLQAADRRRPRPTVRQSGKAFPCGCGAVCRSRDTEYELVALVEHSGGGRGGHYLTYRRIPTPVRVPVEAVEAAPQWVVASDEAVRPVDVGEVLEREAYLLLYIRKHAVCGTQRSSHPPTVLATRDAWGSARTEAEALRAAGRSFDDGGSCGGGFESDNTGGKLMWFPHP